MNQFLLKHVCTKQINVIYDQKKRKNDTWRSFASYLIPGQRGTTSKLRVNEKLSAKVS